jgi:NADPH:quinone reductase-like Zn-dependent oxidoreductase
MKAVIWTAYGPPEVLKLLEVPKPVPKDNEVLIKIRAASVTAGDCEQRAMKLPFWLKIPMRLYTGFIRPTRITILGMDLAGEVEEAGRDVKGFEKGDPVFATTGFTNMGTYAEYICLPTDKEDVALATKPVNLSWEEAAGVPTGGLEALHFIRKAGIKSGDRVLINGAAGTIGSFAVQLAKYFGGEVTAIDSGDKLETLLSIGADEVIDYTKEDFTKNGRSYDVILDIAGTSPFSGSLKSLNKNGRFLLANPGLGQIFRGKWASMMGSRKVITGAADQTTENLIYLKGLIEVGKLKSVVDRSFPLQEAVAAHRYVEQGQKKGNVVMSMSRS